LQREQQTEQGDDHAHDDERRFPHIANSLKRRTR
jgi:hypothetical protein